MPIIIGENGASTNNQTVDPEINNRISSVEQSLPEKADLVNGVIPVSQLPDIPAGRKINVADEDERLLLSSHPDITIAYQSDTADAWALDANEDPSVPANWSKLGNTQAVGVVSFKSRTGNVTPQAGDYSSVEIVETGGKRFYTQDDIDFVNTKETPAGAQAKATAVRNYADSSFVRKTDVGVAGGVAPLDASGMIPSNLLNVSGLNFKGAWDANNNTPMLLNGQGSVGDFYKASTSGTYDFGNGSYTFAPGDWVIFAAGVWQRIGVSEQVHSVNGKIGEVLLTAADVGAKPDSYLPDWSEISNKPNIPAPRGTIGNSIPSVLAYLTNNQIKAPGTTTVLWDNVLYNPFNIWTSDNKGEFIVPAWAKFARCTGQLQWVLNTSGYRAAGIRINGVMVIGAGWDRGATQGTGGITRKITTGIIPVNPGDIISVQGYQTSGSNLALEAGANSDNCWFQIEFFE